MKNYDYLVQDREPEFDRSCLHRQLFPVNMRLLKSSDRYRLLIEDTLHYMEWIMSRKWEDYQSAPDGGSYGISGANLGIPWNIIGYKHKDRVVFMLNPVVVDSSQEVTATKSNCGSIKFKEKIIVLRHLWIDVEWYTMDGKLCKGRFTRKNGGFTIQHEIDHNNGVMITDRYIEQGGDPNHLNEI